VVPADVTDRAAVVAAASVIERALGGIDLASFNAGGKASSIVDTMTLNYASVVYGVQAVLPAMLARGSGHLAAVASLAGYRAVPLSAGYGASKAAVIHLLEALRFEIAPRGVLVTVINPGFVRTPLTASNKAWMPFLMEPTDAAERIVRGFERGREEIHFPLPVSLALKTLRVIPYPIYARIVKSLMRA
jgi:short-subunit dehydrogenase